jgi:hypothetical protein
MTRSYKSINGISKHGLNNERLGQARRKNRVRERVRIKSNYRRRG